MLIVILIAFLIGLGLGYLLGNSQQGKTDPIAMFANMQMEAARLHDNGQLLEADELRTAANKMLNAHYDVLEERGEL